MFQLSMQTPITLKEFLKDYDQASWLGMLRKDPDRVRNAQWSVGRAVERNYKGKNDIYLAYNPLKYYTKRKKKNIGKLALLYVDLDIGRGENPFMDDTTQEYKQEVLDILEKNIFGKTVPEPNFVCDSGRGLYLIYKIYQSEAKKKQEHSNAALRWRRINTYLTDQFDGYCADVSVATDEARVLRIPGTTNSHNGREVRYYKYSDNTYTLYNIERDYMSAPTQAQLDKLERVEALLDVKCTVRNKISIRRFLERHEADYKKTYSNVKPSVKQIEYAGDIARVLGLKCPNFRTAGGASTFIKKYQKKFLEEKAKRKKHSNYIANDDEFTKRMLESRLKRLEKLLIDAPEDSYRENVLFIYRLFACQFTGDKKLAEDMTRNLLNEMTNPLPEKQAMRTTRTAEQYWERGEAFKMSNETLAGKFGLSLYEWKHLLPVASYEADKEATKARNRRNYEKRLEAAGEDTKQHKIAARREEVARLLSDGKSKTEICAELQISERTYYSDVKYIQNNLNDAEEVSVELKNTSAKNSTASSNSGALAPSPASATPFSLGKELRKKDGKTSRAVKKPRRNLSTEWTFYALFEPYGLEKT